MLSPTANDGPRLKAKAAETRNLLPLLVDLCRENLQFLGEGGNFLYLATQELNKVHVIMKREPRRMSAAGLTTMQSSMVKFLHVWKLWGGT